MANLISTALPLQSALAPEGGRSRRSTRVLLTLPVRVSGIDEDGRPFESEGETLCVNKHGAKIRISHSLRCKEVRITLRSRQRSQRARVAYVDEAHRGEFAIELERPENFWGVYFPPADWEALDTRPSEEVNSAPGLRWDGRRGRESIAATQHGPDVCEWFIFEGLRTPATESHAEMERAVRLGPFASENECRILLQSMQQLPRFSRSALAVHKKPKRREKRTQAELPVHIRRPATNQKPQLAHTVDISNSGARLAGLAGLEEPLSLGEIIEIDCDRRNAAFQVVWIGSPGQATEGQAGVACLTPEANIWGLDLSRQTAEEPSPQEIAVARAVQTRLLPQEFPLLQTLDYSGRCTQTRTVGGDYYDFLDMDSGMVGFVLADVAGKGIAAALLMANLQGSLRSHTNIGAMDLAQVLASVNRHFYKHTETHSYATLFFGCYDDATQTLRYVNCGHNPPLLLHQGGVERLTATATVIGLFRDWECTVAEAHLESGDILCIYSDGITEATGKEGKEFGETRLLEVLCQSRNLDAASIAQRVEQAVEQFRSGEQEDDLTMVIARTMRTAARTRS